MKLVQSLIVVAALAVTTVSTFAQTNQSFTRADVKAQVIQFDKEGYRPGAEEPHYPSGIQAAQARVTAGTAGTAAGADFGG